MIGEPELERRAAALGVSVQHAEQDYVLNHLLAGFAHAPGGLVFRGGTALARVYWPDFRLSEDLDFLWPDPPPDPAPVFRNVVELAAATTGLDLTLDEGRWRDDRLGEVVRWTTPWDTGGELVIDVVRHQRPALPVLDGTLRLPYSDLTDARIPVLDLLEILANKWIMLDDRQEPRDLFDLWWAINHERISFGHIASAHRRTYGFPPQPASIERAERLGSRWGERLQHQIRDLPAFDDALTDVRAAFDGSRQSG